MKKLLSITGAFLRTKLNIHQQIAFWWLWCSPVIFLPLLREAKAPDAGMVLAQGIALVTVMIAAVPPLVQLPLLKRWFCWTDALSDRQYQALEQRNLRCYYQAAIDDGYANRVLPYLTRIIAVEIVTSFIPSFVPEKPTSSTLKAFVIFASWYPMGVMLLVFASVPLVHIFRERIRGRR